MTRPWIAEHDVTAALARELIEARFPELAPAQVAAFGVGWDNTVFLVNDAWVFRFPRRAIAVDLLDAENAVLPAIANRLPIPIPVPTMIARDVDARFPWPFAGYRMLPGRTADRAAFDDDQRAAAAVPLARFLAALHALPAAEDVPPDNLRRLDVDYRAPRLVERLEEAVRLGYLDAAAPWTAILDQTPRDYTPSTTTLVHGDLHAANILVDDGCITAVIDWGDVHRGDAAIDLSIAHGFLPPSAHAAFRDKYGQIDDDAWRLARFKALQTAVALLAYGHDTDNADLVNEANMTLRFLAVP